MPFKSEKQKGYLFANKPELAMKWAHKYGAEIHPSKKHEIGEAYMKGKNKRGKGR